MIEIAVALLGLFISGVAIAFAFGYLIGREDRKEAEE